MTEVFAYTDGACSGNPGPGGWGVLLVARERDRVLRERELSGGEALTTNNRMELLAAIHALETLKHPSRITLVTDSAYVKNGITAWIPGWKANGWQTSARKPVKNVDLWQRLDAARDLHDVQWKWVKGHAGHPENERADELARQGMAPYVRQGSGAESRSRKGPETRRRDAATRPEPGKARARRTRRAD